MAVTEEDYKKQLSGNDIFDSQRIQEYSTLYDKEVALENAKAQAMKYTKNQIAASGFGGTGYGSSLQAGTYNKYLNKVGEAESEFNANMKGINAQELTYNTEKADRVTTDIVNSTDIATTNDYLKGLGYGDYDAEGNFVFNEEKPQNMTDEDWNRIKMNYENQKNGLNNASPDVEGNHFNSDEQLYNGTVNIDGEETKIGKTFSKESKQLWEHSAEMAYGSVAKISNAHGKTAYFMMTANGLVQVSADVYNKSSSKHELVRKSKDNYVWSQR